MNSTLDYIVKKFEIDLTKQLPIEIKYSRYSMSDLFHELDFKVGAEIGTEHGRYAEKLIAGNPQMKLFCVDPYMVYPYYNNMKEQEEVETFYEAAKNRLSKYNTEILRMTSMEAVKQFEDNSLDFVFIDGDHYFEFIVNDMIYWSRKVRPSGIVYGHDYWGNFDVEIVAKAYMQSHKINPWFLLHRGGKLIPCWMYVRQEEDNIWPK
jgi:hypothetical protein